MKSSVLSVSQKTTGAGFIIMALFYKVSYKTLQFKAG